MGHIPCLDAWKSWEFFCSYPIHSDMDEEPLQLAWQNWMHFLWHLVCLPWMKGDKQWRNGTLAQTAGCWCYRQCQFSLWQVTANVYGLICSPHSGEGNSTSDSTGAWFSLFYDIHTEQHIVQLLSSDYGLANANVNEQVYLSTSYLHSFI